ncbi:DUF4058 family protein [Urbifossiella limnaea]|uniref:DUF4058 family protein n=1 Tax=Urbifossiella limnaea TaxID=2528023 RepID=A0A517XXX1_9BACT|nr:DUF4058 family protein [Urbifossiella limnaea]QDU22358.1 hypothetical protein ETAA1_43360 [Urbifossiella limnaea]
MPSPFPGMDPYLEHPALWPDVHHELISAIREQLNQVVRPRYIARVEERLYLASDYDPTDPFQRVPDVTVGLSRPDAAATTAAIAIAEPLVVRQAEPTREARVEVRDARTHEVVTVIEVLSHANKTPGSAGRRSFLEKRDEVLASPAHWVEIDLLRAGAGHRLRQRYPHHTYLVYSSPTDLRPDGKAWRIRLQDPLPVVGVPLREPDPDAPLDLGRALVLAYDRAAYDATVDYAAEPTPPLPPDLAAWADGLLREKKLR